MSTREVVGNVNSPARTPQFLLSMRYLLAVASQYLTLAKCMAIGHKAYGGCCA